MFLVKSGHEHSESQDKAWHIAMSEDETLLTTMKEIVNPSDYGYSITDIDTLVNNFIYQWTGTEDITGNRGSFDAKKLAAMEEIRGVEYSNSAAEFFHHEITKKSRSETSLENFI